MRPLPGSRWALADWSQLEHRLTALTAPPGQGHPQHCHHTHGTGNGMESLGVRPGAIFFFLGLHPCATPRGIPDFEIKRQAHAPDRCCSVVPRDSSTPRVGICYPCALPVSRSGWPRRGAGAAIVYRSHCTHDTEFGKNCCSRTNVQRPPYWVHHRAARGPGHHRGQALIWLLP